MTRLEDTRTPGRRGGAARVLAFVAVVAMLAGACTTVLTRSPVPASEADTAAPYGIVSKGGNRVRDWGDELSAGTRDDLIANWSKLQREAHKDAIAAGEPIREISLALSGGGPDGAFGAGVLNGWSARGDRPEFTIVTGISTGAIIAVFAFLGPDYDDELTEVYTTYETSQLMQRAIFAGLTGGTALMDTRGYRGLIERYIDDTVVQRLAEEYERGRALLIGTTNLDAARPVFWNASAIAASGHPMAKRLIHDIVQASSAIPAVFPPVLIPVVTADGKTYDEMHVDGGATQQVMFFSPELPMRLVDEAVGARFDRSIYVIMNNKLRKPYDPVRPRVVSIAGSALSSLLGGAGSGDVYKIYAIAERDGIELNVLAVPTDFDREPQEAFDRDYMKALYDVGYEIGLAGDGWSPTPPEFEPWP